MKAKTVILLGLVVILCVFLASNVYAIERYTWGMKRAEAIRVLQETLARHGMSAKEKGTQDGMVILDTIQSGKAIGSSVFHFDSAGGLVGVGSLIYMNTEEEALFVYKHTNKEIQTKTQTKIKGISARKTIYMDNTEQIVVFITQEQQGAFAVGIATSKLKR